MTTFPKFSAIVKGRQVYDYRTLTTGWSDNPALVLADVITNDVFGLGESVNSASIIAAANYCDEDVSGSKRRTINIALTKITESEKLIATLRTYAGCFVVNSGGEFILIPDKVTAYSADITASNIIRNSLTINKGGIAGRVNTISVKYTNITAYPHKLDEVSVEVSGLSANEVVRSNISLPGFNSASLAKREATERLNKMQLQDLQLSCVVFDEALEYELGDVVRVTHPMGGLSNKEMRIIGIDPKEPGRWALNLIEYDPAVYSNDVETTPTYPDTYLPDPLTILTPENATGVGELYRRPGGQNDTRILLDWELPSGYEQYYGQFEIQIKKNTEPTSAYRTILFTRTFSAIINNGLEFTDYDARIRHTNSLGIRSDWVYTDVDLEVLVDAGLLPTPLNPKAWFAAGEDRELKNVWFECELDPAEIADPDFIYPDGVLLMYAFFKHENKIKISSVSGSKAYIDFQDDDIITSGTLDIYDDTEFTTSSNARTPNTTNYINVFADPVTTISDFAGQWWVSVEGSLFIKVRYHDEHGIYLEDDLDSAPLDGDSLNYVQIRFADERPTDLKRLIVTTTNSKGVISKGEVLSWDGIGNDGS